METDKKSALENLGFEYINGRYQKLICENAGKTYTLTCEIGRAGYKVDTRKSDGSEQTNDAGTYRNSPIWEKIEAIVKSIKTEMENLKQQTDEIDEKKNHDVGENEQTFKQNPSSQQPNSNLVKPNGSKSSMLDLIYSYVGNDVLEIFGETGSGKSKLSMEIAKQGLAAGKKVYYLDTERNITKQDMEELKGCTYKYTPVLDEIDRACQTLPACDIVIVDSIGFPILTTFARMSMKQKGDALLKLIAIFGDLKTWAYKNNGIVIVTNQPESDFNKAPGHVLRPFGDKSQFAAKEILKTEIIDRRPDCTRIKLSAFRSRSVGHGTKIADVKITSEGVESSF